MQNLEVHNQNFITFADTLFTVDVLGGVDTMQIENMICTLRISAYFSSFHKKIISL
jgi:hypothetical protein